MSRPVFLAGRGAVTGFGRGVSELCERVFAGETALRRRSRTAAFRAETAVCGEFPAGTLDGVDVPERDLPLRAALMATEEALAEAGCPEVSGMGVVLATTKGDMSGICGEGVGLGSPIRLGALVSEAFGFGLRPTGLSCACASGVMGIASAARRIALGECDRLVVVAADAVNEFILRGFGGLGALDPGACRPFDAERRGVSLGDGAGAIVLSAFERESIGIRVRGYGGANDACHVTGPDYDGLGVALAARRAVQHAGLELSDIDALHLHATGTRANDSSEAIGLADLWAEVASSTPPAFGSKGQTGHTLGAAGVIESLLAVASIERRELPGHRGLSRSDCDQRLDVKGRSRPLTRSNHVLKVASGFGGVQGAVVFSA
ncbi:MAG: beta-ketoacyl synthase N-terminal-like domain-containing protein [Planctomycetota bacterium]|nr:beta-ketoacyl synthase N-terminal-like domain-containing protein [Planctomycetota bacterium]